MGIGSRYRDAERFDLLANILKQPVTRREPSHKKDRLTRIGAPFSMPVRCSKGFARYAYLDRNVSSCHLVFNGLDDTRNGRFEERCNFGSTVDRVS